MSQKDAAVRWQEIVQIYGRGMTASTALLARRYAEDFPKHALVWLFYGSCLGQMSRFTDAIQALRRAATLLPSAQLHLAYFHLGQLHERKGAFRIAEQWYRRAIENRPSDAGLYIVLGRLLTNMGRLPEAKKVLLRATKCKEGCREEAFLFLGRALTCLGNYREAKQIFQKAFDIDLKYKEAKMALSDVEYIIERNVLGSSKLRAK